MGATKTKHSIKAGKKGDDSDRINIRINRENKEIIQRGASLSNLNLTEFVKINVIASAKQVIAEHERVVLNENDSLMVMKLLENPAKPNKLLQEAAKDLYTYDK